MNHKELLLTVAQTIDSRGAEYGPMAETHARIARIASEILGKEITAYDVAIVHHATKLARIRQNPNHIDSYIDGAAYLSFGAELIDAAKPSPVATRSPRAQGVNAVADVLGNFEG